jgi:hypothetical protein
MERLLPILLILIAIGLFFGYTQPTYTGSIAQLSAQVKSYDSALAAANAFKAKEAELETEQQAVSPTDRARLESFLPDGVDNVQLILDLNALATRSGIKLSDFTTDMPDTTQTAPAPTTSGNGIALTTGGPTDSLNVSVTGIGSYKSFRTFLAGIESSLRPLDLESLSVSDSDSGVYSYNMRFRIYWLK